ncbi:DUF3592 domain-containing protein [Bifidobacterium callitrichos]|uniref:DUF3592 domain-containing protein n=1 Tax=Bifidobacterium callitrichos DSM 23973 TaxID=1437609 RepID=A0A086ZWH5_9BIFI|nr:DUF3592 domain-containing protein [Bifidobacterium callitrichos]KFI50875.1 hypothetical protein BCAL_2154 [Bifidobacterium callitrichos DSM 23973]
MLGMGVIMLVGGSALLFSFAKDIFEDHLLTTRATASTEGTMLSLEANHDSDGTATSHYYVVRYEVDGIPYELKTRGVDPRYRRHPGDPIDIDYDPNNPKAARATFDRPDGKNTAWTIVVGLICGVIAIAGALMIATSIG